MKILAIIGSPHGMQGNTGRLLNEMLAGSDKVAGRLSCFLFQSQKFCRVSGAVSVIWPVSAISLTTLNT